MNPSPSPSLSTVPKEIVVNHIARFLFSKERLGLFQAIDSDKFPMRHQRIRTCHDIVRFRKFYTHLVENALDTDDDRLREAYHLLQACRACSRVPTNDPKTNPYRNMLGLYRQVNHINREYFIQPLESIWVDETYMSAAVGELRWRYHHSSPDNLIPDYNAIVDDFMKLQIPAISQLNLRWKHIYPSGYTVRMVFSSLFFEMY